MRVYYKLMFYLLLVLPNSATAQEYLFNDHVLMRGRYLDTDTSPARIIQDSTAGTWPLGNNQCSSISDADGNLIAYSDGRFTFDGSHNLIKNSEDLCGTNVALGTVFVPKPGSDNEVYLVYANLPGYTGGYYAVYNVKSNIIDPLKKKIQLHNQISGGFVFAVRHSNNYDWWVIFTSRSNLGEMLAFKVTCEGISSVPVYSYCPSTNNLTDLLNQYSFSSDGRLFALASEHQMNYIINFDRHSGKFIAPFVTLDTRYNSRGLAFSESGCTLITSSFNKTGLPIYSHNVSSLDTASIYNSSKMIYSDSLNIGYYYYGSMFTGKDGTIYTPYKNYILRFKNSDQDISSLSIDSLNNDSVSGKYQTVTQNVIDKFKPTIRNFTYENQCLPDTTQFHFIQAGKCGISYDSLHWDFGDTSNYNYSSLIHPKHLFPRQGEYLVNLIKFDNGKADTISEWVTIAERPRYHIPADTVSCDGQPVGLRINIENSNNQSCLKSYWNNIQGPLFRLIPKSDTIVTLLINQLGCEARDTAIVHISEMPKGNMESYTICHNDTFKLAMKTGSSIVYWANDSSTTGWTETEEGTYYLNWKDGFGCERTDTVNINKKEVLHMTPNRDTTVCLGDSVLFSVPITSLNILWSNGDTGFTYMARYEGLVKVVFEDSIGCAFTDSIYFNANDSIPDANFTFPKVCTGDLFTLESNGGVPGIINDYLWLFNGKDSFTTRKVNLALNDPGANWVELVITASNGCQDSVRKEVQILAKPIADFIVTDACDGDSVLFLNSSLVYEGYESEYTWRLGDGSTSSDESPNHLYILTNDNEAETFNVTLVANIAGGCSDSLAKTVTINPLPNAYFEARIHEGVFLLDSQATKEISYQYRWTFGNGNLSNLITPSYTYPSKDSLMHTICLRIINDVECVDSFCSEIKATLGLDQVEHENHRVYPNPTDGTFRIEGINGTPISVQVFDNKGLLVTELDPDNTTFDISGLPEGMYQVRVVTLYGIYLGRLRLN